MGSDLAAVILISGQLLCKEREKIAFNNCRVAKTENCISYKDPIKHDPDKSFQLCLLSFQKM